MFNFVVRHLRWFARVPGLPQFFDGMLLAVTCGFGRSRLAGLGTL